MDKNIIFIFLIPLFLVSMYYLIKDPKFKLKSRIPRTDPTLWTALLASDVLN